MADSVAPDAPTTRTAGAGGGGVRVLALDYGSARCGCAVSDPTGTLATPIDPVLAPATRKGMGRLVALVCEREVGRVVVGLPLTLSGEDSDQTRETRAFAERLRARLRDTPVDVYDERLTTRVAQRLGGEGSEDSRAAAVLLDDWLARHGTALRRSPGPVARPDG